MVHWRSWHLIKGSLKMSDLDERVAEGVEEEYL
jgi:hypothetical protein